MAVTSAFLNEVFVSAHRARLHGVSLRFSAVESLIARLQFLISGVSYVNAVGRAPLTVSAFWVVQDGSPPFTTSWTGSNVNLPTTASMVTLTLSGASGLTSRRTFTGSLSAQTVSLTSSFTVTVLNAATPTPMDGKVVYENQPRRRLFPL